MIKIAYLGLPGSYSFLAGESYFGTLKHHLVGKKTFKDIFDSVVLGNTQIGIVPLENSSTGSLYQTYDLLLHSDLKIAGEVLLKINHCLLVEKGSAEEIDRLDQLNTCYSHIEALKQCQKLFADHKNIAPVYVQDTASAAEKLAKGNTRFASAIANRYAANQYGFRYPIR